MSHLKWFRPMQGKTFHLETGRESASFGFSKLVSACGKSFFEGEKYLRGDKKNCKKCESILNNVRNRLEYLRGEIEAERISYGEIIELQSLVEFIDPSDTVLLEWAGAPEYEDEPSLYDGDD